MADQDLRAVFTGDDRQLAAVFRDVSKNLKDLQRNLKESNAQMRDNRVGAEGLSEAFREFGAVGSRTSGGVAQGLVKLAGTEGGLKKVTGGLSNLALRMVGLEGATGKLVEGMLLLGAGGVVVTAVAAGVAILGAAYRALTADLREAEDRAKKLDEQLERIAEGHRPERISLALDLQQARADLQTFEKQLGMDVGHVVGEKMLFGISPAEIIDRLTGRGVLERDARAVADQVQRIKALEEASADASLRDLAHLRDLHLATPDELAQLAAGRERLQTALATARTEEERLRIGQLLADTAEKEAKAREKSRKELTEEQKEAAKYLQASATAAREEAARAAHGLGRDSFLMQHTVNGLERYPYDPKRDVLQDAADAALARPSPIIGSIGRIDTKGVNAAADNLAAHMSEVIENIKKGPVFDLFQFIEEQGTAAFDNIFAAVIQGGQSAGEVVAGIFRNLAMTIGHLLSQQLGEGLARLLSPTNTAQLTAGSLALTTAGGAVAAGGAAVTTGATTLAGSAAATLVAAGALNAAAVALAAANVIGFDAGGFTGPGPRQAVAGIVHAGEFVIQAASTEKLRRHHPGVLESLNVTGLLPGYATGGMVLPLPADALAYTTTPPLSPEAFARHVVPETTVRGLAAAGRDAGGDSRHRIELGLDEGMVLRKVTSSDGQRALLSVMRRNRHAFRAALEE